MPLVRAELARTISTMPPVLSKDRASSTPTRKPAAPPRQKRRPADDRRAFAQHTHANKMENRVKLPCLSARVGAGLGGMWRYWVLVGAELARSASAGPRAGRGAPPFARGAMI